jgi:hypothetical protein
MFPLWMWNCFLNNLILCLCNVRLRSVRPLIKMVVSIVSRTEVCAVKFFEDLGWQTMSAKFTQAKVLVIKSFVGLRFWLKLKFCIFLIFFIKPYLFRSTFFVKIFFPLLQFLNHFITKIMSIFWQTVSGWVQKIWKFHLTYTVDFWPVLGPSQLARKTVNIH